MLAGIIPALLLVTQMAAPTTRPAWTGDGTGETLLIPMKSAPYPHASRAEGFKIQNRTYPRDPHYTDSTVALFIPKGYRPQDRTDLLVYFHGHMNSVRKALDQYKLREQIVASGRNVILIFPEGPKDAGDSGCGRLEEPDGLKNLVAEAMDVLVSSGKAKTPRLGRVLIAGHSGAYRAISFCVEHGGLPENVTDVALLDSSYARLDAFVDWVGGGSGRRLFSIFTDHLGGENVYLMTHLKKRGLDYELLIESDARDDTVARARILFLHAEKLNHEQTVTWLERWLRGTTLSSRH